MGMPIKWRRILPPASCPKISRKLNWESERGQDEPINWPSSKHTPTPGQLPTFWQGCYWLQSKQPPHFAPYYTLLLFSPITMDAVHGVDKVRQCRHALKVRFSGVLRFIESILNSGAGVRPSR
jgi:hypothetical protein